MDPTLKVWDDGAWVSGCVNSANEPEPEPERVTPPLPNSSQADLIGLPITGPIGIVRWRIVRRWAGHPIKPGAG